MSIRAKFKVDAIERSAVSTFPHQTEAGNIDYSKPVAGEMHTIKMSPVYGNNDPTHENTKFWSATPTGSLQLGCVNAEAGGRFEIGKEYYIDFTLAE
jgi:hypothetical protein